MKHMESVSNSFGRLTFWQKEYLRKAQSLKMSHFLNFLSTIKLFGWLRFFSNPWVVYFKKVP